MGLDQWLTAKTKLKIASDDHTGVCSGLFGIVPKSVAEQQELGYWRKAYDQDQLITYIAAHEFDDDWNLLLSADEIDEIISEAKRILAEHEFDEEDGNDSTDDDMRFDSQEWTWMSKQKWEDTIKFFEKAKEILALDPEAQIYYHIWF